MKPATDYLAGIIAAELEPVEFVRAASSSFLCFTSCSKTFTMSSTGTPYLSIPQSIKNAHRFYEQGGGRIFGHQRRIRASF